LILSDNLNELINSVLFPGIFNIGLGVFQLFLHGIGGRVGHAGFGWLDNPQNHYEIEVKSFENGYYEDANLLDEFVEQCSENKNDLVKNAGLWSGIWNRLSGWAKRVFFKEYRELYKIAKEANEKITERVEEAQKLWKEAQKDFNNYELVLWREKILSQPIFTKDLMVNYEKAFGNLVAFTYKLREAPNATKEKGILEMTPPGEGGEGKVEPPKEEEIPEKKELKELDDPWFYSSGVKSIMENGQTGEVAIEQERLKRSMKWGQVIYVNGEKDLIKYNDKYKGKATRGLKEALGDDVWQISTAPSGGWVFLMRYEKGIDEEPKQSFETIEEPSLPEGMKSPEYLKEMSEEVPQGLETPEEKVEELTKKKEVPLKGSWVVFLTGPNKGKAGLVKKPQPRWHWMINDEAENTTLGETITLSAIALAFLLIGSFVFVQKPLRRSSNIFFLIWIGINFYQQ